MDDLKAFESQIARVVKHVVGPPRPVDAMEVARAAATQPPKWRFQTMFSATKYVVAGAIAALFGSFLLLSLPAEQPAESAPAAATSGPGTFSPAGSMPEARGSHTATLLPDGQILVLGGTGTGSPVFEDLTAAIWDPEMAVYAPAGSITEGRVGHTVSLLPDGRVLVVGGSSETEEVASAEIWDPETASFSPTGSLAHRRSYHTATALSDGRVVVIGGMTEGADEHGLLLLPEVWDPATGTFSRVGSLAEARFGHTATLLSDGRSSS